MAKIQRDENGAALPVKREAAFAKNPSPAAVKQEQEKKQKRRRTAAKRGGKPIGEEEIAKAKSIMMNYFSAKKQYDQRYSENFDIYNLLYTELGTRQFFQDDDGNLRENLLKKHIGAQTLNVILNKHADAMDNYPEPVFLPREKSDEETAAKLSCIVPCVLERNRFQKTYSDAWTDKLVGGVSCYAVTWDPEKENGLGDIRVTRVNILSLAWEPYVEDIQDSAHVFCVNYIDVERLKELYPQLKDVSTEDLGLTEFKTYDARSKTENKAALIDWYYKKDGVLHFCKFAGIHVLFSTENEPEKFPNGLYDHGKYPFVLGALFPLRDTPVGFSFIDICRSPQGELDELRHDILKNIKVNSQTRSLVDDSAGVSIEDLTDLNKDFIKVDHLQGNRRVTEPLETKDIAAGSLAMYQALADEIKMTTGTNDASNGASAAGVTSGAAIAALQEAGGKISRDVNKGGFEEYTEICIFVFELMRQFYNPERWFRITGEDKKADYVQFGNEELTAKDFTIEGDDTVYKRLPVFDIEVKAQRSNPFTTAANNQMMVDLFRMGAFAPENADAALNMLECMMFEGKDKLIGRIKQNAQLLKAVQELQGRVQMLEAMLAQQTAQQMPAPQIPTGQAVPQPEQEPAPTPEYQTQGARL